MNYTNIFDNIAEKVTNFASNTLSIGAEKIGFNPTNITEKLFLIVLLAGLVYLGTKIGNKIAKTIAIVAGILLIGSIIISII